jgi:hypothetical protein
MVVAAVVARKLGVAAEGRPLEELSSDHELIEGPR